ncbi:MAG: hypothetical protein ACR2H2_08205 [Solirubrobacteraceae bacterium]
MADVNPVSPWWMRPSAPGPLKATLGAHAALLLPVALGAALDWPWWLAFVLLIPGLALHTRLGLLGAQARGLRSPSETPRALKLVMGAWGAAVGAIAANVLDERYIGLAVVVAVVSADLAARLWWRHHDGVRLAGSQGA